MRARFLFQAVFVLLSATVGASDDREAIPLPTGSVRGVVLDAKERPVVEALVVLCEKASGVPVSQESGLPFIRIGPDGDPVFEDAWIFGRTDATGAFSIEDVAAGEYRLVAQSWPDVDRPEGPREVNGLTVHLRGVEPSVTVPSDAAERLTIRPLGDGVFVYTRGAGNDDWYVFLSTEPVAGDAILGPLGWRGAFLQNGIGYARMPRGQILVRGLPGKRIGYAIFASDSRPGFAAGTFHSLSGKIVSRDTNLIAGWSDGVHEPPERLKGLVEELRVFVEANGRDALEIAIARGREEQWAKAQEKAHGFARAFAMVDVLGPLDRVIELASGTKASLADVLAAAGYVQMAQ